MVEFVNPYTFIPLPTAVVRSRPNGHDSLKHLAGTLKVTLTAETPLIIREGETATQVPTKSGRVVIRGSSLHGSVRALHETIAGGCLRVIDRRYVPSYRQVVEAGLDELTMAVVEEIDDVGRATKVRLCETETWVDANEMHRGLGPVDAGELVYIREDLLLDLSRWRHGRYEIHSELTRGQASWIDRRDNPRMAAPVVAFITDIGARNPRRGHYWAVGPLTNDYASVSDQARKDYADAVAGTDDVREAKASTRATTAPPTQPRQATPQPGPRPAGPRPPSATPASGRPELVKVVKDGRTLGRRFVSSPVLKKGQPIWVRLTGPDGARVVQEIRLSKIWRQPGKFPIEQRINQDFLPCSDRDQDELILCPSCGIFGAAEELEDGEKEGAVQLSYAGHVSVGDALSTRPATEVLAPQTAIAPLMGPHPSSGHFYLDQADSGYRGETTWGANPDQDGAPRQLRGRKFYWRSSAGTSPLPQRAVPRGPQNTQRSVPIKPVKAGATFEVEVQFTNLTEVQLGSVIASLKPDLLFDHAVLSVGYGKPFGFGAVSTSVEITALHRAEQRYGKAEPLDRHAAFTDAITAFRRWRDSSGTFTKVDAAARHVLALDFIADDLISYPFDDRERHAAQPTPGYQFFKNARGGPAGNAPKPLYLPDPSGTPAQQSMDSTYGAGR